jgi:hypothetical protein
MQGKMKFQEVKPPPQMMLQMAAAGSRSIRVWARDSGNAMVTVIQSEDPSRDDGSYEWHLSVSASDSHGPRYPNKKEVAAAMDAAGWLRGSFTTSNGGLHTVHVYRKDSTVKDYSTVGKDAADSQRLTSEDLAFTINCTSKSADVLAESKRDE